MIIYQEIAKYGKSVFCKVIEMYKEYFRRYEVTEILSMMKRDNSFFTESEQKAIYQVYFDEVYFIDRNFYDEISVKLLAYKFEDMQKDLVDIISLPFEEYVFLINEKHWEIIYQLYNYDVKKLYDMCQQEGKVIPDFVMRYI